MPERLGTAAQDVWGSVYPYLPMLGVALAILVGGCLIAYVLRAVTFAALKRTDLDNRLARRLGAGAGEGGGQRPHAIEHVIAQTVFYLALAFVFVAFFSQLRIEGVTAPVVAALSGLAAAVPNLIKALVIGAVGFVVASLGRRAVVALVDRTGLSERLSRLGAEGAAEQRAVERAQQTTPEGLSKLASLLGDITYWVILAVTAVPVLEALRVGALAEPLTRAFDTVTAYLPRVAGALLLLALGYAAARLLGGLVSKVSARIGVDRLAQRLGGGRLLRGQRLSGILGAFVMAFVLLHFAISAVGRLGIPEISMPLGGFLDAIYAYLPRLFVGGVVLALGAVAARIAGNVTSTLLASMGFNTLAEHIGLKRTSAWARAQESSAKSLMESRREGESLHGEEDRFLSQGPTARTASTPADFAGIAVSAVVGVVFLTQALRTMELHGFAVMLERFIAYLPSLFAAGVVLAAAMWAGRWCHRRVDELTQAAEGDRLLNTLGTLAHVAVVSFGAMAAMQQLGVANSLIGTAFGLVLGALCLAAALAFGLGGREVAGDIVKREYKRHQHGADPAPGE